MAKPRAELSALLHDICDNVKFQPPTGTMLTYPCIIYKRDNLNDRKADNRTYVRHDEYQITYITRDPDDMAWHEIADLELCSLTNTAISDNLYHYYYRIYF